MTCLQLCVLFNFQIRVTFSPVFMNIFLRSRLTLYKCVISPCIQRSWGIRNWSIICPQIDYTSSFCRTFGLKHFVCVIIRPSVDGILAEPAVRQVNSIIIILQRLLVFLCVCPVSCEARFLKVLKCSCTRKAIQCRKIIKLLTTELFYSYICNMSRGSLQQEVSGF